MLGERCPYCGAEVEINHDDGYGLEENEIYEQECGSCEKTFVYTTTIHTSYNLRKADCLNDGQHEWVKTNTFPEYLARVVCRICGEVKEEEK